MSKRDLIIQLTEILATDVTTISFFESILESLAPELEKQDFVKITDLFHEKIVPSILEDMYNLYEDSLDEDFLKRIIDFYTKGDGLILREKTLEIQHKMGELSKKWETMMESSIKSLGIDLHG